MLDPEEPIKGEDNNPHEKPPIAPMAEDIGSAALGIGGEDQAIAREEAGWSEPISDEEFRENPNYYRPNLVEAEEILERAKKSAEQAQKTYDSEGRLRRRVNGTGKLLTRAEARTALAKENYQDELREAQRYIERDHAEAHRYVQSWQEYIVTQEILADAMGKETRILRIEDFIREWELEAGRGSMNDLNYERFSKNAGVRLALRDFFIPHMILEQKEDETLIKDTIVALETGADNPFIGLFGAKPDKGKDRDLRSDITTGANVALKIAEEKGYDQIIKFDRLYGTIMYKGDYSATRRLVVEPHYIPVPPEVVNLITLVGADCLSTKTTMYQQGQYKVPREEIEISTLIVDIAELQDIAQKEAAPYRKTITLPGVRNHRNSTEDIVTMTIGADSEEELQKRILEEAHKRGSIEFK